MKNQISIQEILQHLEKWDRSDLRTLAIITSLLENLDIEIKKDQA